MIEKTKAFLQNYRIHSKVLIIGFFAAVFLVLIFVTVTTRISQDQENRSVGPTPTPSPLIPGKDYVEGQISVKFKEEITDVEINEILTKYDASIESTIPGIEVKVIKVPVGQEQEIVESLINEGIVEYAELNYKAQVSVDPNDAKFNLEYGFKNTGQDIRGQKGIIGSDVKAISAWEVTKGKDIKVAVIDTGLDMNHPEFEGKVIASKFFITQSVDDGFGHGTHVAGTIAANTDNSIGVAGICPDCKLLIAKVLDNSGSGDDVGISNGIVWAADNGAKVINLSVVMNNGIAPNTLKDAIEYALGKDIVIVAAAGNCGSSSYSSNGCSQMNQVLYPAAFQNVVAVANTDNRDARHPTSNHGSYVDIAAPGADIVSTMPTHQNGLGVTDYGYMTGTSMASPLVAGIAALILSANPNFTNQQVVDRLLNTADKIEGTGTYWQKGRVNAAAAVASGSAIPSPSISPAISPGLSPSPTATTSPSPTTPVISASPSAVPDPSISVPPFVCGGSPDSICTSPTITVSPDQPIDECLDPRGTTEKINDWVNNFIRKIQNYISEVLGNPQQPLPPPPVPCIVQ